jgi:hypothetical protein
MGWICAANQVRDRPCVPWRQNRRAARALPPPAQQGRAASSLATLPSSRLGKRAVAALALAFALGEVDAHAAALSEVSLSPAFFNPSLGQKQEIRFRLSRPGVVTVKILDRDRFPIRALRPQHAAAGWVTAAWDGRDQEGRVVPDEAYNLRLELSDGKRLDVYDPSAHFHPAIEPQKINFYSARSGILGYTLTQPARVHAEAGQATLDPASGQIQGPVLKTLIDSQPRVAGEVIEPWNGLDVSGEVAVPTLPHFVVSVLALTLPPSSMITSGNRSLGFAEYAKLHRPAEAALPRRHLKTHHHLGLTALEDRTPSLKLTPAATWDARGRRWEASGSLQFEAALAGDAAPYFLAQPSEIAVWVDESLVADLTGIREPLVSLTIGSKQLRPGLHRIAVNWGNSLGPLAVGVFQLWVTDAPAGHQESR